MAKENENAVVEQPEVNAEVEQNDFDFGKVFETLAADSNNHVVKNAEIFSIKIGNRNKSYIADEPVNPADLFLTIKVNRKVNAYREDESGEFVDTVSNQFQIGYYSFLGAVNNSSDSVVRRMAAKIQRAVANNCFAVFEDFFNGSHIDIVQQEVLVGADGTAEYTNPFSQNGVAQTISHNMWISYIGNIKLDASAIAGMNASRAKSFDW